MRHLLLVLLILSHTGSLIFCKSTIFEYGFNKAFSILPLAFQDERAQELDFTGVFEEA